MRTLVFAILLSGVVASASGQIINDPNADTITIVASDPVASEAGPDVGLFKVQRQGPANYAITVFYEISGTASNGVDYQFIPNSVRIEVGSVFAAISINPIPDNIVEGNEIVRLRIVPSPLLCPTIQCGYNIGSPSAAWVTISDVSEPPPTNRPPVVRLDSPDNGEQFITPVDVWLRASAQDAEDGNQLTLEFFAGDHSLGFGTFVDVQCPNAPSECPFYSLVWTNAPAGDYVTTAKPTDRGGAFSLSDPAAIPILRGVNIIATDPDATKTPATVGAAPDTARFTIGRAGRS